MSREYLKNKELLSKVTYTFNQSINKFYQLAIFYIELEKTNQLNNPRKQLEIKKRTEDVFERVIAEIKEPSMRTLGTLNYNKQTFMYPIGTDKILKLDVSKGDVRTLHIYDLEKNQTYSLSQSALKVTMVSTSFQKIFGIVEMDENWKKCAR